MIRCSITTLSISYSKLGLIKIVPDYIFNTYVLPNRTQWALNVYK